MNHICFNGLASFEIVRIFISWRRIQTQCWSRIAQLTDPYVFQGQLRTWLGFQTIVNQHRSEAEQ